MNNENKQNCLNILKENNIGIWELSVVGGQKPMLFCNDIMKQLLGLEADASPEQCYEYHRDHIYEEDINIFNAYANKLFEGFDSEIVYRYKTNKGSIRLIRCTGARIEYSDCKCVMRGMHKDITDIVCFDYKENAAKESILKGNNFLGFWKIEINNTTGESFMLDNSILLKLGLNESGENKEVWKKILSDKNIKEIKDFLSNVVKNKSEKKNVIEVPVRIKDNIKWIKIACNYIEYGDQIGEILGTSFDVSEEHEKDYLDHITNGLNRKGFTAKAEELFAKESKNNYAMIYVNINNFKAVNEIAGFKAGDELLKVVYDLLNSRKIINAKIVARKEADHFAVITRKENIDLDVLEKASVREWNYEDKKFYLSSKIGIYYINEDIPIERMIDRAKLAKNAIENTDLKHVNVFKKEYLTNYIDSADVIRFLPEAIQKKQFEVFYQPIIDASTGEIASAEALVRWKRKNKYISPGLFVPVLEEAGLISNVDFFVAEEVHKMLTERDEARQKNVPISINLSWSDLNDNRILETINSFVVSANSHNKTIKVELTETTMSKMNSHKKEVLDHLKLKKINLLLDDFGTGYSSFNTLNEYDFDILKIDKKFIDSIMIDQKTQKIVKAIINMCHALNMKTVAEGVEEEDQYTFLKENNCDYIQGYYFSKPLNRTDFETLLDNQDY